MKIPVLAALTCLSLAALPAFAAPVTFNVGDNLGYTVPVTGQYTIIAVGAKGGDGVVTPAENGGAGTGGLGAEAGGTFFLTQGERLGILVGATGLVSAYPDRAGYAGGGGGGSFVTALGPAVAPFPFGNVIPLVVAGGGGGGGAFAQGFAPSPGYNGGDALIGPDGGDSIVGSGVQAGGTGGHGGNSGQGGITTPFSSSPSNAGLAFNDLVGGRIFGPVGAAGGGGPVGFIGSGPRGSFFDFLSGGGGGGGYSGGGGGGLSFEPGVTGFGAGGGGGGGSFTAGANPVLLARIGTGDGFVTITPAVAVPEPGALALFGMGLFGLCAVRQARRR